MNNTEIIKGIDLALEGLKTIKNALTLAGEEVAPKTVTKAEPNVATEEPEAQASLEFNIDVEKLKAMKYNEFKKFASSLGVKCTGTRDEIMARILEIKEAPVEVEVEPEEEESVVEETPVEKSNIKKFEKKAEEPAKDEFDEQAEAIAEETPLEDIIDALESVDLKATKKNAVTLLAKALREGLIEIEDDEDEEDLEEEEDEIEEVEEDTADEEADDEEEDEEEVEIDANSYFSDYDPEGYNDPEGMSKKRAKAVKAKMSEILTSYYDNELSDDEIASYVEDNATEEEIELLGDEYTSDDVLMLYMELVKRTIDNDGDEHEPSDPYEVGNNDMCCGHELKYIKKTQKYVCEHCGTEYEAE